MVGIYNAYEFQAHTSAARSEPICKTNRILGARTIVLRARRNCTCIRRTFRDTDGGHGAKMTDSYLTLARQILLARGKPLTATEILTEAEKYGMLPEHLRGKTMYKTLQARISEEIVRNRFRSGFYRTNPGTYFLRELAEDPYVGSKVAKEYPSIPRRKPLRRQRVLCVTRPKHSFDRVKLCDLTWLFGEFDSGNSLYMHKLEADRNASLLQVLTFTVVVKGESVLVHKVGKFTEHTNFRGCSSIGFRSFLSEFDIDLLNDDTVGARRNSSRELIRHIHFCEHHLCDLDIINRMRVSGALIDAEHQYAGIIVTFDGTDLDFEPRLRSKAKDINQPRWVNAGDVSLMALDAWSKLAAGVMKL